MTTSTKLLFALLSVGGATYAIHRKNRQAKAELSKKRREEQKKAA